MENKKFYVGKYTEGYDASRGWFIGSYVPENQAKTDQLEIIYKSHQPGDTVAYHKHEQKIEVMIIIEGKIKCTIEGQTFNMNTGDFYFLEKGVASSLQVLEPTRLLAIHSPCVPSDKILLENTLNPRGTAKIP